jgi:predicted acyl esterase
MQIMIAANIFRGRYRESLEKPAPIKANRALEYRFPLPETNHTFLPGHRLMVQVQSSWFPLYDRNPQTWVDSIMDATPEAYRAARHRIHTSAAHPSRIELPVYRSSP